MKNCGDADNIGLPITRILLDLIPLRTLFRQTITKDIFSPFRFHYDSVPFRLRQSRQHAIDATASSKTVSVMLSVSFKSRCHNYALKSWHDGSAAYVSCTVYLCQETTGSVYQDDIHGTRTVTTHASSLASAHGVWW